MNKQKKQLLSVLVSKTMKELNCVKDETFEGLYYIYNHENYGKMRIHVEPSEKHGNDTVDLYFTPANRGKVTPINYKGQTENITLDYSKYNMFNLEFDEIVETITEYVYNPLMKIYQDNRIVKNEIFLKDFENGVC